MSPKANSNSQLAGEQEFTAEELSAQLAARGLVMLGAFVPVALKDANAHEAGVQESLKIARLLAGVAEKGGYEGLPFLVLADDNAAAPATLAATVDKNSKVMLAQLNKMVELYEAEL